MLNTSGNGKQNGRTKYQILQEINRRFGSITNFICCLQGKETCGCDCSDISIPVDVDFTDVLASLEAICEKIENQTLENENNLICSSAKACNDDCDVVICHTCYDVEGNIVSINHTNPDGTEYAGDLSTLDLGCTKCGDDVVCNPYHGGGCVPDVTEEPLNNATFIFPECNCSGVINTSIGAIPFYNGMTQMCIPESECTYTITSVDISEESICTPEDIKWYASRNK